MKLLTKEIEKKLPSLYSQEDKDPDHVKIIVKFFDPTSNWTWYATEYDPKHKRFFGFVKGHEGELGYFTLDELEEIRGLLGLGIERDKFFGFKHTLAEVMETEDIV